MTLLLTKTRRIARPLTLTWSAARMRKEREVMAVRNLLDTWLISSETGISSAKPQALGFTTYFLTHLGCTSCSLPLSLQPQRYGPFLSLFFLRYVIPNISSPYSHNPPQAITIISDAIICSASAWNFPVAKNADLPGKVTCRTRTRALINHCQLIAQLRIDTYMIFLGAFSLLVVTPA